LDGKSLVPLLSSQAAKVDWPDRTLFVHVQRQEIPPVWVRSAVMTEQWRLLDGKRLYHIQSDPGQHRDRASDHPKTVAALRQAYERWWAGLKPAFTNYGYIVLGSTRENPSRLSCHDWHAENVPWHQGHIRNAPWANGYWMVRVEQSGHYEFVLRQQPQAAGFPIQASHARVTLGTHSATATVAPGASEVRITLPLSPGPAQLQTWLIDAAQNMERGAFFVDVRLLEN
jgi:hypothetical protein